MVVHFRFLKEHKKTVLSLYKALLRHATYLNQSPMNLPQHDKILYSSLLKYHIKVYFKQHKNSLSGLSVRRELEYGLQIELDLRSLYSGDENLNKVIKLVQDYEEKEQMWLQKIQLKKTLRAEETKLPSSESANRKKLQELKHEQQVDSYTKAYIRSKQYEGVFPPKITNENYVKQILTTEAIFFKNLKRLKRETDLIYNKGPSRARIVTAPAGAIKINFLRLPWGQHKDVHSIISNRVKTVQKLVDTQSIINSFYNKYAIAEGEWEYLLSNQFPERIHEFDNEADFVETWTEPYEEVKRSQSNKANINAKNLSLHNNGLKLKQKRYQELLDLLHSKKKRRFEILLKELKENDIGPHSDLVRDPLGVYMQKHRFKSLII